jgi:hypothetical protein
MEHTNWKDNLPSEEFHTIHDRVLNEIISKTHISSHAKHHSINLSEFVWDYINVVFNGTITNTEFIERLAMIEVYFYVHMLRNRSLGQNTKERMVQIMRDNESFKKYIGSIQCTQQLFESTNDGVINIFLNSRQDIGEKEVGIIFGHLFDFFRSFMPG